MCCRSACSSLFSPGGAGGKWGEGRNEGGASLKLVRALEPAGFAHLTSFPPDSLDLDLFPNLAAVPHPGKIPEGQNGCLRLRVVGG